MSLLFVIFLIWSYSTHLEAMTVITEQYSNETTTEDFPQTTEQSIKNIKSNSTSQEHLEYVLLDKENHPCARTCVQGEPPMICRYNFTLENYYTLTKACYDCPKNKSDCFRKDCVSGDGHRRSIYTVNRKIPGPAIQVCHNDLIVVDLANHLMSEGTTMHWHGQHQVETPYMDGVPYVTQCPIPPHTTFRYSFRATQSGTHFWHSHMGMQRVDGVFGSFIVKVPAEKDPHDQYYDFDLSSHVMMLIDWDKKPAMDIFLSHHHSIGDNKPATLLINGLGRFKKFETEEGQNKTIYTPLARLQVEQGYRYRFRIINAGFLNCPIEISIDNHTMTVISSDGNNFAPIEVESLVTYAGERFDFILNANQAKDLYWIRYRGLMDCDERFTRAHQVAVLEYKDFNKTFYDELSSSIDSSLTDDTDQYLPAGNPDWDNSRRGGKQLNALNRGTEDNKTLYISVPDLESMEGWDSTLKEKADVQIYMAYDFYTLNNNNFHRPGYEFFNMTSVNNQILTPQLNHITMATPSFALLPQRNEIPKNFFCNQKTLKGSDCESAHCECPHGYEIPLNAVVELIMIDEGFAYDANHPFHLHGHSFRVVAMERVARNITVDQIKQRDQAGLIKRNLLNAPVKDTVTVPDGGYTVLRFQAKNPGYWIFHCHIEFHAEIGMAVIFKVGTDKEMLPVPQGFPKCGNYIPLERDTPIFNETDSEVDSTESTGNVDEAMLPECSRSNLLNSFEKYLFGNECRERNNGQKRQHWTLGVLYLIVFAQQVLF